MRCRVGSENRDKGSQRIGSFGSGSVGRRVPFGFGLAFLSNHRTDFYDDDPKYPFHPLSCMRAVSGPECRKPFLPSLRSPIEGMKRRRTGEGILCALCRKRLH